MGVADPVLADQDRGGLAAADRLFAEGAALGIEIEEDVVPAVFREPVADLDGLIVVEARMTDEKARHGPCRQ